MAKAKKLPSGSWRCLVYSHMETVVRPDGTTKEKRIYKSFTCDEPGPKGKRMCEQMAADWAANKEKKDNGSLTFGEALDNYIASRENILSPRTIREYKSVQRNHMKSLMDKSIDKITQEQIQSAINIECLNHSSKTVRNIHGIISSVMKIYRPDLAINTALPQKQHVDLYIPTDSEVKQLIQSIEGTDLEIPVLLAAFGPMRRGEICALEMSDISSNVVHVSKNMVKNENNEWVIKSPKSYAGDRYIDYPDFVAQKWEGMEGRLVSINPDQITNRFRRFLQKAGMPHFRFHDLRHYSASIQHALGIPDSYIMQRGGWGNDGVLKSVYRHALKDKTDKMNQIANTHFSELMQHDMQHKIQ